MKLLLVAAVTGVLVAGCGGSGGKQPTGRSTPATPAATATPAREPGRAATVDRQRLGGGLVAASDLGGEWQRVPSYSLGDEFFCGARDAGSRPDVAVVLRRTAGGPAVLIEGIAQFERGQAQPYMERLRATARSCGEWVSTDGGAQVAWQIAPDDAFPPVGEQSVALRFSSPAQSANPQAGGELIYVRRGDLVGVIQYASREADRAARAAALAARLDEKLKALTATN